MTAIPYWHVDAFSAQAFGGNQAAVMVLDQWLPDESLVAIAAENLFAETAFLVRDRSGAADWELRWFTPTCEVELCGHATLASGHVLLNRDGGDSVTFRTRHAGILEVVRQDAGYELALPAIATTPADPADHAQVTALLGAAPLAVADAPAGYGVFLYPDEAAVRALRPDLAGLREIDLMIIATAPGTASDIVSRVFVPAWGVDEDSVTGSAHGVLGPFWAPRLGRSSFTAHQASTRGGDLAVRLAGDKVWLGGACATVVEGRFYL
ncbi:MAG: PhzF family phenazine biosynthesis protein [Erythrobacter sp.]